MFDINQDVKLPRKIKQVFCSHLRERAEDALLLPIRRRMHDRSRGSLENLIDVLLVVRRAAALHLLAENVVGAVLQKSVDLLLVEDGLLLVRTLTPLLLKGVRKTITDSC